MEKTRFFGCSSNYVCTLKTFFLFRSRTKLLPSLSYNYAKKSIKIVRTEESFCMSGYTRDEKYHIIFIFKMRIDELGLLDDSLHLNIFNRPSRTHLQRIKTIICRSLIAALLYSF